jgi:hypothetical protein
MNPTDDSLHFAAAMGFALRRDWLESLRELEAISLESHLSETILSLKVQIFRGLERWDSMEAVARKLVTENPLQTQWVVALACAKRLKGDNEGANQLLKGIFERSPRNGFAIRLYQLASYACVLGEPVTAEAFLKQSIVILPALLELVREDPELKMVRKSVKEWL